MSALPPIATAIESDADVRQSIVRTRRKIIVLVNFFRSFKYTRQAYKIGRRLARASLTAAGAKSTEEAIRQMKTLWTSNHLLRPIIHEHQLSVEALEQCYWDLSVNGAGQCVSGYHVASASLCFPVPLQFVLENIGGMSYGELARTLLCYFEQSDPYLPVHAIPDSTISIVELLREAAVCREDERYEQAIPYWEQAAKRGSAEAQYYLWQMHTEGWGGLEDFNAGLSFLRKAADQGYGKAELELAEYHAEEIIGGKRYAEEAIYWGTRAFEHGFVEGATIVGNMYAVERPGVKKDDAKAFSWFRKAAEAGDAYAQYQVGVSYEHGLGVEKNIENAHSWYEKARNSGCEIPKEHTLRAPINMAKAKFLAIEHLCEEGRGRTTVEAQELPSPGAYGFDPVGWVTFCVNERVPYKVGGSEYIAVNLSTGEVRSLGIIGE